MTLQKDQQLAELMEMLDQLHTAASEGQLQQHTTLNKRELIALLNDMIYTAQETIDEINTQQHRLRVLEKPAQQHAG